jgi:hypothetical protein
VLPVQGEPFSGGLLTGKNTGKIHQNGFIGPLLKPEVQYFRPFFAFPRFQLTGNGIFNNRERAENNREEWKNGRAVTHGHT